MSSIESVSLVEQARVFASEAHAVVQQVRKYTGEPYINHPQEVVAILLEYGITDPVMLAAAWLHDVVEDTGVPSEAIHAAFGNEVGCLVDGLTDTTAPSDGPRAVRKAKARAYLAAQSPACKTIKLADLISNTRSIAERDPVFAVTYMAEKRLLLEVLRKGDAHLWAVAHALACADQQEGQACAVTA